MIKTDRLIIREFTADDVELTYLYSIEESRRNGIPNEVYDSIEHAAEVVEYILSMYKTDTIPHVLAIEMGGKYIGHISVSEIPQGVEIGYAICEAHQGNGYATEAVIAYCKWAKAKFGIETLYGITLPGNTASQKVLMKSGFTLIENNLFKL